MTKQILYLNFKFNLPRDEYENTMAELAQSFAEVTGLQWKVWTMNEADKEAGGIYLFEDETSLETFLAGDLAAKVKNHPAFSDMSVKPYEVLEGPSRTTRGPL